MWLEFRAGWREARVPPALVVTAGLIGAFAAVAALAD